VRRARGVSPAAGRRLAGLVFAALAAGLCLWALGAAALPPAHRWPASRLQQAWPGLRWLAAAAAALSGGAAEGPLAGIRVAVDAGHGGTDRGACHLPSGLIEKEINLDMAMRLERALAAAGAEVLLTRRDDTFLPLDERARLANEWGAGVFVSLHVNRYPSPACFGAQTFHLPGAAEGERLALLIQEELRQVYPPNYRQALPGNYRVLRETTMPAALVEIGFVTNATDRALMQQDDYREQVAAAIVQAIVRFVHGEPELPAGLVTRAPGAGG